jgi:hypothetical protein
VIVMTPRDDHAISRAIAARARDDARARRVEAGAVTELARALLRDAREAGAGRRGPQEAAEELCGARITRRRRVPAAGARLAPLPLAARSA